MSRLLEFFNNQFSKYILFLIIGIIIGIILSIPTIKNNIELITEVFPNEIIKSRQLQKEIKIKMQSYTKEINTTKIDLIKPLAKTQILPIFIIDSFKEMDMSTKDLDQNKWELFLETYTTTKMKKYQKPSKPKFDFRHSVDFDSIKQAVNDGSLDLNKPDSNGLTPIRNYILYAKNFNIDELNFFKEHGADFSNKLDLKNKSEQIDNDLIFSAMINGHQEVGYKMIKFLENNGASLFNRNYKIHLSIVAGKKYKNEYYSKVLPLIDINEIMDKEREIKIYELIIQSDANNDIISSLFKRNLNITTTPEKENVLHYASKNSHISNENYQKFIDLGSNVNARDSNLRTPLMLAVLEGKVEQVKILLKNGADINLEDKNNKKIYNYLKKVKNQEAKNQIKSLLHEYGATMLPN